MRASEPRPRARLHERPWTGRRCVVTGVSGFIGTAVGRHLRRLGAQVHGLSRGRPPSDAVDQWSACDIVDMSQVRSALSAAAPEVVIHLAGKVTGSTDLEL